MMPNRVPGHTLRKEGRVWSSLNYRDENGPGIARCSCGADSSHLASTAARKRWHRAHKDEVRATGDAHG